MPRTAPPNGPRARQAPLARLFACALAAAAVCAPASAQAPRAEAGAVLFAVQRYDTQQVTLDPVAIVRRGRLSAPPTDDGEPGPGPAGAGRFVKEYFRAGRKYRLLFGGGEAGTAAVVKRIEPGCFGMEAEAAVETSVKLGGEVLALATDSPALGLKAGTRRAPTEAERAAALDLARKAFRRHRVPASRVAKMGTNNLTAVDTNGDGRAELIGSFIIRGEWGVREAVFLIAEPSGAGFTPALAWFHRGEEAEAAYRRLVDVVDLDGDGTTEVVAQGLYYESHDYIIYKRQAKGWRQVYQGAGGGC